MVPSSHHIQNGNGAHDVYDEYANVFYGKMVSNRDVLFTHYDFECGCLHCFFFRLIEMHAEGEMPMVDHFLTRRSIAVATFLSANLLLFLLFSSIMEPESKS